MVKYENETYNTLIQEPEKRISVWAIAKRFKLEEESIEVWPEGAGGPVAFKWDKETGLSVVYSFTTETELRITRKSGMYIFIFPLLMFSSLWTRRT